MGCRAAIAFFATAFFLNPFGTEPATAQRPPGAQAQTDEATSAPYTQQYESHVTVRADHTTSEVVTRRFKVLTQSAIASVGQQKLFFVEGKQNIDITEAYTEKSDGRRVPVEPKNILTQDASPEQGAIYFRDQKQRTVIFPDVGVGDTLVMTHKRELAKRVIFKQFSEHQEFPRSAGFTSIKITVEAPVSMGVRVKAIGDSVTESVTETGGTRRHTIVITPQPFAPEEVGAVSGLDRDPVVLMSTYKSYQELGAEYGQAALPKAAVTPSITALANEITKGITDRKAQAVAIDAWMKKNIRSVAVILGSGRTIPNEALTVLKNKFGDCKDVSTLMAALLAAKGIASEQALINLGNAYTLPEPPTLVALNHVLLYFPEFDLYDDPGAQRAAFGVLAYEAYDKPVVRVAAGGAKMARTPAMKPDDSTVSAKTIIAVAADGTVTGQTEETGTGALGMALRASAAVVQTLGDEAAARRQLQKFLTPGTGHFDLGNFTELTDPVVIKSSFTLDDKLKPPPPGGRIVITHGLNLWAWPGVSLLGERLSGRQSAFVCYAGRQTEDLEVTFDPALPLPQLFAPTIIDNPAFTYRSTMKIQGRTLISHREFVSRVERQVCPPEREAEIAADLTVVRTNVFSSYAFMPSPPAAAASPFAAAAPSNPLSFVNNSSNLKANLDAKSPTGQNPPPVQNPPAAPAPPVAQNAPSPPAATSAPAPPPQVHDFTRTAAADKKLRLEFLYSIQPDCSSVGPTTVRIFEQPQHGTLAIEDGQGFTNFPKDNQRYECNTRRSDGTLVFYQPGPGYTGADSLTLDIIFPSGSTAKWHYSIEVK
jgi:transglutaminase-like putative cysteine protease